ncbi:RNA pseudouridine synthase [bacterium]|nr:RNA pseudouridine synthase [bacterium]
MKYRPRGFDILHEDRDLIIGNKSAGFLTVAALWEKEKTIHGALTSYIRKGSAHSKKEVYVVHRLDQATSGVLIFAKTLQAQEFLKENWKNTIKTYYAIVHGTLVQKEGTFTSHLIEDKDYKVSSTKDTENGKLAITEYKVVKEESKLSLVKINLLTGKKNQIRVHMAEAGHPIVGDAKYGKKSQFYGKNLLLHSSSIELTHPFNGKRMCIKAEIPDYFRKVLDYQY